VAGAAGQEGGREWRPRDRSPERRRRVIKMRKNKGKKERKKKKKKDRGRGERERCCKTLFCCANASVTVASAFESRGGTRGEKSRDRRAAVELFHRRVQLCSPTCRPVAPRERYFFVRSSARVVSSRAPPLAVPRPRRHPGVEFMRLCKTVRRARLGALRKLFGERTRPGTVRLVFTDLNFMEASLPKRHQIRATFYCSPSPSNSDISLGSLGNPPACPETYI